MTILIIRIHQKAFPLLICLLLMGKCSAQIFEPFAQRFLFIPSSTTEGFDNNSFDRSSRDPLYLHETSIRFPIQFGTLTNLIIPDFAYKRYSQSFNNWPGSFSEPHTSDHFRLVLKGVFPLDNTWNLLLLGGIAQGLNDGTAFNFDQNFYRFGAGYLKNLSNGNQFGFALQWISEARLVVPVPVFKGTSRNKLWDFDVEGPRAIAERSINSLNQIRIEQKLDNDRFFFSDDAEQEATNYGYTHLNYSVGWTRTISGPVKLNVSGGVSPLFLLTLNDGRSTTIETVRFSLEPTFSATLFVSVNPNDYLD